MELDKASLAFLVIALIVFCGVSTALVSGFNSSGFLPVTLHSGTALYGEVFSLGSATTFNFAQYTTFYLHDKWIPAGFTREEFKIGADEKDWTIDTTFNEPLDFQWIWLYHTEPHYILRLRHNLVTELDEHMLNWEVVSRYINSTLKVSFFMVHCEHYEVGLVFNYSQTEYGSLQSAWNSQDVYLTIGLRPEYVTLDSYDSGIFNTIARIFTLDLPETPEIISILIAFPFYATVGVTLFLIAMALKPDWL